MVATTFPTTRAKNIFRQIQTRKFSLYRFPGSPFPQVCPSSRSHSGRTNLNDENGFATAGYIKHVSILDTTSPVLTLDPLPATLAPQSKEH